MNGRVAQKPQIQKLAQTERLFKQKGQTQCNIESAGGAPDGEALSDHEEVRGDLCLSKAHDIERSLRVEAA